MFHLLTWKRFSLALLLFLLVFVFILVIQKIGIQTQLNYYKHTYRLDEGLKAYRAEYNKLLSEKEQEKSIDLIKSAQIQAYKAGIQSYKTSIVNTRNLYK